MVPAASSTTIKMDCMPAPYLLKTQGAVPTPKGVKGGHKMGQ